MNTTQSFRSVRFDLKISLELLQVDGLGFMSALLSFAGGSSLIPKVLL